MLVQPKDSIDNPTEAPSGQGPDGLVKVRDLTEAETAEYLRRKALQDQPNFHEVVAGMAARQSMCLSKSELEKLLEEFNSDEALALIHPGLVAWKKEFLTIQNETIQANKLVFFELAKCTPPPQTVLESKELSNSGLSVVKQQKELVAKAIKSLKKSIDAVEGLMQEDAVMASLQAIKAKRHIDEAGQGRRAGRAVGSRAVASEAIQVLATKPLLPVLEGMKAELLNLREYSKLLCRPGKPSQQLAEIADVLVLTLLALGVRPTFAQNSNLWKLIKAWQVYWSAKGSIERIARNAVNKLSL